MFGVGRDLRKFALFNIEFLVEVIRWDEKKSFQRKIRLNNSIPAKKKTYKCPHKSCRNKNSFASLSSLNEHRRIQHKGVRWICPICEAVQSSKYSQERHFQRYHSNDNLKNADENRFTMKPFALTDKARKIYVLQLTQIIEKQKLKIAQLQNELLEAYRKLGQVQVPLQESIKEDHEVNDESDVKSEQEVESEDYEIEEEEEDSELDELDENEDESEEETGPQEKEEIVEVELVNEDDEAEFIEEIDENKDKLKAGSEVPCKYVDYGNESDESEGFEDRPDSVSRRLKEMSKHNK